MSNKAVVTTAPGKAEVLDVPMAELPADDYIIVKVAAVAINPTDWKHVDFADKLSCVDCYVGCDYSGTVVKVGPKVTKKFSVGQRICGIVNGSNMVRKTDGAFAEYIAVKGDLQIATPDNITDEEAATLGVSITTVGQGLYQALKLALPTSPSAEGKPILIYGGSTATGIYGIQFAKLSGYKVITTSSPKNFEYLKSLGADAVVDYRSASCVDDIRAAAGGSLKLAWDCNSSDGSAAICARALDQSPDSEYSALLGGQDGQVKEVNPQAKTGMTLAYSAFGEPFGYGGPKPAVMEDHEFAKMFWEVSRELLAGGKVKPIRVVKNQAGSGLEGVIKGMDELKNGKVSAAKLVYTL